jgi:hypothetical protein
MTTITIVIMDAILVQMALKTAMANVSIKTS